MADLAWPQSLPPYVERPGYREKLPDVVIRTPMDAGPDKLRLESTTGIRGIEGSIVATTTQKATFEEFFRETTRGGSLPFDFLQQRTGETIEVYFHDEPQIGSAGGDYWVISFHLDTMDPVPTDPSAPQFLMEGLGYGDVSDFLMGGLG